MSISRPARCLLSNPPPPTVPSRLRYRNFHTSPSFCERRRPKYTNVKAADMGLIKNKRPAPELYKAYSDEEKALLSKKYTPEQIRAIELGEKAIPPEDIDRQGVIRSDIGSLSYLDDFRHYRNVIDKKPEDNTPEDPNARFMTEAELGHAFADYHKKIVQENPTQPPKEPVQYDEEGNRILGFEPSVVNFMRAEAGAPSFMGTNGPLPARSNLLAHAIPRKLALDGTKDTAGEKSEGIEDDVEDEIDPRDPDGVYSRLRKQTGYTLDEIRRLNVKILVRNFVANQTRLGKIQSIYCIAIAGNGDGVLGLGQAKGQEAENTMNLAKIAAIRNMKPIPRYEQRTIFGEVEAKVSAVEVKLMARPPGFGLRCQYHIFEMARAAGIHDLAARVPRSRNKMNTVKATYEALMKQRIPDEVARSRGKKLVDVRKVYYGGRV